MTTTYSRHATSLMHGDTVEESDLGPITRTADTFPILKGLSLKRVLINPRRDTHAALARERKRTGVLPVRHVAGVRT